MKFCYLILVFLPACSSVTPPPFPSLPPVTAPSLPLPLPAPSIPQASVPSAGMPPVSIPGMPSMPSIPQASVPQASVPSVGMPPVNIPGMPSMPSIPQGATPTSTPQTAIPPWFGGKDAANSASPVAPTQVQLRLEALMDVNPDITGRSSPVFVKVYQLKEVHNFYTSDFFPLYQNDKDTLGSDLVYKEEFMLRPGEKREWIFEPKPETLHIAILAAFRQIDSAHWRGSIPIQSHYLNVVEARLARDTLALTPGHMPNTPTSVPKTTVMSPVSPNGISTTRSATLNTGIPSVSIPNVPSTSIPSTPNVPSMSVPTVPSVPTISVPNVPNTSIPSVPDTKPLSYPSIKSLP